MTGRGPTKSELQAAAGRLVPGVLAEHLDVLFCGINPGLYSAAVGHHFARPGNRFWKALYLSGFTASVMDPVDDGRLCELGLGVTNLVARSSATAVELSRDELRAGAAQLRKTVAVLAPRCVAFLGMMAFRVAFERPKAVLGEQPEALEGARVWLLPNPSGAQARYQLADLAASFAELRATTKESG